MATDLLQKEVVGLSEADINLLVDFARYLKYRVNNPLSASMTSAMPGSKKRKIGFLSESFVSIAADFDDTPECMKDYV